MNERKDYIDHIANYKDSPELIKIITGVRRCGKSTLMKLYHGYLIAQGVPQSSIVHINFEDFRYRALDTATKLHEHISSLLTENGTTYILLDEIQMVDKWQDAINSLRLNRNNDIYLTGSNATLLSGSMATLLSGRYVEIKVLPLSFLEFVSFHNHTDIMEGFNQYLLVGGLPGLLDIHLNSVTVNDYLSGVVNTIIIKDITTIAQIRDIDLLRKIILFLASNIGQSVTATSIAHYLTSSGRKITIDTVDNYLKLLEEAYIFLRAGRFNIKGKNLMKTNNKFYIVDLGLRNALIGTSGQDYGSSLENIIFLELVRRGFQVTVGKYQDFEIDFIAEKPGKKIYMQVSASIIDEKTKERELRPLQALKDNYPKLILTMDKLPYTDFSGIKQMHIPDFLLSTDSLIV